MLGIVSSRVQSVGHTMHIRRPRLTFEVLRPRDSCPCHCSNRPIDTALSIRSWLRVGAVMVVVVVVVVKGVALNKWQLSTKKKIPFNSSPATRLYYTISYHKSYHIIITSLSYYIIPYLLLRFLLASPPSRSQCLLFLVSSLSPCDCITTTNKTNKTNKTKGVSNLSHCPSVLVCLCLSVFSLSSTVQPVCKRQRDCE